MSVRKISRKGLKRMLKWFYYNVFVNNKLVETIRIDSSYGMTAVRAIASKRHQYPKQLSVRWVH